jgi:aminopeptidase N
MLPRASILLSLLGIFLLSACTSTSVDEGVSLELAENRKATISDIVYKLRFDIPKQKADSVHGLAEISFNIAQQQSVVMDFRAKPTMVKAVSIDNRNINYKFEKGHIIIPKKHVSVGTNTIQVSFISNNGSLNRREDFLYTLLVPDRASTVFPCFDQPDLKAKFQLSLTIPAQWTAISNGKVDSINYLTELEKEIYFNDSETISTYLFAFATGDFKIETKTVQGRTFSIYHRETDREKLDRNLNTIFNLHAQSLSWLEDYTGIAHPFPKLDIILIPGFQYSGMEHPGAIYYRDSRLLLEENPTENQQLRQANLIAHEVAHQWFGNLVTMRWFNDVWLKEVFAGFMADQIVNPQYPTINHELSFMLSHFPSAYSVDRTQGANPIVQELDNMLYAGTLYGDIIYHKAPIMMQQLVMLMGNDAFQQGVQEYLNTYQMGNASWSELVFILDKYCDKNLKEWAQIWTEKAGRPAIAYSIENDSNSLNFEALNATPFPPMYVDVSVSDNIENQEQFWLNSLPESFTINSLNSSEFSLMVNSSGKAYGYFMPDSSTLKQILTGKGIPKDPVSRASQHISLYEMFLGGKFNANEYAKMLIGCIENETESQIQGYLLNILSTVFWRFSDQIERDRLEEPIEQCLWSILNGNLPIEQKRSALSTLFSVFTTNESFSSLYTGWTQEKVCDISLSENERTRLAYELMIRKPELYHAIALGEIERIDNPDRVAQFDFTLNAVSPNLSDRIKFFEKLQNPANRKPEPWVSEALRWLHHPLRSDFSIRFIAPSLDMLPQIQQTGDIFFPKSWLDATLWGHSSPEAYEIVNSWIEANPDLSPSLKMKLLQSADMLFRANGTTKSEL